MIMNFDFVDIPHAGAFPHRCTLLVQEADDLSSLSTSMKPHASSWELAERDVVAHAVERVSTRPATANIEYEYGLSEGAFHIALGDL